MPSLHDEAILRQYINDCKLLWGTCSCAPRKPGCNYRRCSEGKVRSHLINAVNRALRVSGVPTVTHNFDSSLTDALGCFDFQVWRITFGTPLRDVPRTHKSFAECVNTVYHEARHCEQWFRIAQLAANGMLNRFVTQEHWNVTGSLGAVDLRAKMSIPARIARIAVMRKSQCPVDQGLVNGWYYQIYGIGSPRRGRAYAPNPTHIDDYNFLAEERDAWKWGDRAQAAVEVGVVYPNLHDWMALTAKSWLHMRSDALVAVDNAIKAYESDRSGPKKDDLKVVFDHWNDTKTGEVLGRNKPDYCENEGCITKLDGFLAA